jgi:hypothetical protein
MLWRELCGSVWRQPGGKGDRDGELLMVFKEGAYELKFDVTVILLPLSLTPRLEVVWVTICLN